MIYNIYINKWWIVWNLQRIGAIPFCSIIISRIERRFWFLDFLMFETLCSDDIYLRFRKRVERSERLRSLILQRASFVSWPFCFTLTKLNPFIYPRGGLYREGNGWKFSIGRSTVHLPDKLFSLCLRIPAWIFRVPPSARIRLKSLFAPACFSPSPALFPHLQPLRLSAFDAGKKKEEENVNRIENASPPFDFRFYVLKRRRRRRRV